MPPVLVGLPNIIFVHFSSSSHGIFTIERAISVSALTSSQMMKMMLVVIEILIKWWWKTCSQIVCTFLHYSWPHSSHVSDDIVTDTNWLFWCLDVYVCVCVFARHCWCQFVFLLAASLRKALTVNWVFCSLMTCLLLGSLFTFTPLYPKFAQLAHLVNNKFRLILVHLKLGKNYLSGHCYFNYLELTSTCYYNFLPTSLFYQRLLQLTFSESRKHFHLHLINILFHLFFQLSFAS